jgi:hypothetical protein
MKVLFPVPERMVDLGYPKLAFCPYLIDEDGSYLPEASQYLRERSLGEWIPRIGQDGPEARTAVVQTSKSRESMARRLIEFLRWCQRNERDWRTVSYLDDLLGEWQPGLLLGTESTSRRKLKNETVNGLLNEAVLFSTWSAIRKYREPFHVLTKPTRVQRSAGNRSHSHRKLATQVRQGALPPIPSLLTLPTDDQLRQWLSQVHLLRGPVKRLECETIIRTGMRITECNELLVTDVPAKVNGQWPRDVLEDDKVRVWLHRGVKGQKVHTGSLESVKPRHVYLPLDLADRIDHYVKEGRSTLIQRAIQKIEDKEERQRRMRAPKSQRLWIGEVSGRPFTTGMLYKAWTSVPSCPENWHPHSGRDFFAVDTLVSYMRAKVEQNRLNKLSGLRDLAWLDGLMRDQIRILLSPLLGHVSEETSMIYLKAAKRRLVEEFSHPALIWDEICGEDEDA